MPGLPDCHQARGADWPQQPLLSEVPKISSAAGTLPAVARACPEHVEGATCPRSGARAPPRQPPGRRRYKISLMNNFAIGVDLGGTNLRIAAVDEQGHLVEKVTVGTKVSQGRDQVIDAMCDAIQRLTAKYKDSAALPGIGIGVAGIIDLGAGPPFAPTPTEVAPSLRVLCARVGDPSPSFLEIVTPNSMIPKYLDGTTLTGQYTRAVNPLHLIAQTSSVRPPFSALRLLPARGCETLRAARRARADHTALSGFSLRGARPLRTFCGPAGCALRRWLLPARDCRPRGS